ncbi:ATP-binding protein [Nonomuraea sp. NPDC004580]|uniref:ATP-binding protein n=1 Tax=Nonomuraea sp. NPDC004580 TaxID=3154552 RepID=UPI0033B1185E
MTSLSDRIRDFGDAEDDLKVVLSSELIGLLSQQLYKSPIKAIEELVVNAYDADASECWIGIPGGGDGLFLNAVYVFDNGSGMDHAGLADLWHVGHSKKAEEGRISSRLARKQIGKFGIGKLATYSLAYRVTYLTRTDGSEDVRATTLDYRKFMSDPQGAGVPVSLPVRRVDLSELMAEEDFTRNLQTVGIDSQRLSDEPQWTLVILEELKNSVQEMKHGRLLWVLSTAMPLGSEFRCYVNGDQIHSSKENLEKLITFSIVDIAQSRIDALNDKYDEDWRVEGDALVSSSFPSGVTGDAFVTRQSLYGKSDDIARSNGFFVRVRDRLVDTDDPLFGMRPLSYEVFSRFRAEVSADDLDAIITAPREGIEQGGLRIKFTALLEAIYYEARSRYGELQRQGLKAEKQKNEGKRDFVDKKRLVERPTADALTATAAEKRAGEDGSGAEADGSWFYLDVQQDDDLSQVVSTLYNPDVDRIYRYQRVGLGRSARMVAFDPLNATFTLNADHDVVRAYDGDAASSKLLEDLVCAEALLEVYLRERGLSADVIGEVLEQRDLLLRNLTRDNVYSLRAIAQGLLASMDDERDLETNLVVAARALGFVAKHLSGAGNPDGLARFTDYPTGVILITLEAKSSSKVPSLSAIDFAGLMEHVVNEDAHGCLLVAPAYPGDSDDDNAAARRAQELKISCWTVQQLADVLLAVETRHLTARHVLDIVLNHFRPADVAAAVRDLLAEERPHNRALYGAVVRALTILENRLLDRPRTKEFVEATVVTQVGFEEVQGAEISRAIEDLAGASMGAMDLSGERIILHTSVEELARRVSHLLGDPGPVLGPGTFRQPSTGSPDSEVEG